MGVIDPVVLTIRVRATGRAGESTGGGGGRNDNTGPVFKTNCAPDKQRNRRTRGKVNF